MSAADACGHQFHALAVDGHLPRRCWYSAQRTGPISPLERLVLFGMRRELFDYVHKIRAADKYFDVSLQEIQRALLVQGKCDIYGEVDIEDENGLPVTASLRLNIAGGADRPLTSWSLALKLHNVRIDGVDHEFRFDMPDGTFGHGWHRHQWNASDESAERHKLPVGDHLQRLSDGHGFLVRSLTLLNIQMNSIDHGQDELLFA